MPRSQPGFALIRHLSLSLAALGVTAPLLAGVPDTVDPKEIPGYRVIRAGLAVGGQPSPEALTRLGEMGFKTIVNLRTRREGALEEEPAVRATGLDYVWVPVSPSTFSLRDIEAVESVLDDPGSAPVLLHCASSNRVGAVWAAIRVRDGRTLEEAEAAGRAAGLRSPALWEAVLRVLDIAATPVGADP